MRGCKRWTGLLDWAFFYGSSSPAEVMIVTTHTYGTGSGSYALYKVLHDSIVEMYSHSQTLGISYHLSERKGAGDAIS